MMMNLSSVVELIRVRDQQSMLVVEYCSGLLEGNAMLLGIRCRLDGIPFEGDFVHT